MTYEQWKKERPELARLEELEELGGMKVLSPEEAEELEELYKWRDEYAEEVLERGDGGYFPPTV